MPKKPIIPVDSILGNPIIDHVRQASYGESEYPLLPSHFFMPDCAESPIKYKEWIAQARAARRFTEVKKTKFCTDCLPEYQEKMVKASRCSNPDISFVKITSSDNEDYGDIRGVFLVKSKNKKREEKNGKR